jgi:hypothetical protein
VYALGVVNDGPGPALFAGGRFTTIGSVAAERIARWDGAAWTPLGSGIPGEFNSHGYQGCCANVRSIASGQTGGVLVAGNFIVAGGVTVESIGDYSGGLWHDLAGGIVNSGCTDCARVIYSMTRFGDPGIGPLYAAGTFDLAGGVAAARVAHWDGQAWSALGAGIGAATGDLFPPVAQAVIAFQGSLYIGGAFSRAGSVDTNTIARWDGTAWSAVGGGVGVPEGGRRPSIDAMAVYDDGRGQALYVGGILDEVGGVPVRNIARWDGATWSALGDGVGSGVNDRILSMAVFDDGSGPALYAGGEFADAGGASALNIASWNGQRWLPLGDGADAGVYTLAVFDDGSGQALWAGGEFNSAGGVGSHLARWVGCPTCYANCDRSTAPPVLNVADFVCFQSEFAAGDPRANCDGSTGPPTLNVADFVCFLSRFAAGCP